MKKIIALTLAAVLVLAFAACSGNKTSDETTAPEETTADTADVSTDGNAALTVINTIWASYAEDDKFPVAGGDPASETGSDNSPAVFELTDAAAIDSYLGLPEASLDKVEAAASAMNLMNANNFTCGAFLLKNADDAQALCSELKENIMNRQWMCGFPDRLVIIIVDNVVLSAFGAEDLIDTFKANTMATYTNANIVSDDFVVA